MKLFLDTSSLFKLYHNENGTEQVISFFNQNNIHTVFLAEITKIEFDSVVWKKLRIGEITREQAKIIMRNFERDWIKYLFIEDNQLLKDKARRFISIYCNEGLRTLDSIQLASAVGVKNETDMYLTSDHLLLALFKKEALPTFN